MHSPSKQQFTGCNSIYAIQAQFKLLLFCVVVKAPQKAFQAVFVHGGKNGLEDLEIA